MTTETETAPDTTTASETTATTTADELRRLQSDMDAVADSLLSVIPEHLKALIPDELGAAAKIRWYKKASEAGAFKAVSVPETDGAKKPTVTPKTPDISSLPVHARIAAGYRQAK